MLTYVLVGIGAFAAGALTVILCQGGRPRSNMSGHSLNSFNFDKQKKYEKDGRKFPFSY
ncbi:hypothetical protein [Pseudodesulfovibrio sp.]|uniref:hypothetical protein n=1 Tax=Pseudodesulfovibrio sp. TaxID=2035812 RepID=UPI0026214C45|nr:hypothetical protein [Pseudodesulfovibrio sp.]MDD3311697.1 hypothetical protein [Pseudodesulfovibrio sp.]